jgi:hypothetical protein
MAIGRREMLQRLIGTVGAGFSLPGLAAAHPLRAHLLDPERVAAADASAARGEPPRFLDAAQLATLTFLAERIVPGSTTAGVAPFIDRLLAVDKAAHQKEFLDALRAIDAEAAARFQHPWQALGAQAQTELLTAVSTLAPAAPAEPRTPNLRDHFDHLKGWIAGAYYSSEAGMRELGFTGALFFTAFPGCEHPEGHR